MSKLCLHIQNQRDWMYPLLRTGAWGWVKWVNPTGDVDPWPGVKTLGRPYIGGDNVDASYVAQGALGAGSYMARIAGVLRAAPWVRVWEGPNEQYIKDAVPRAHLVEFTVAWTKAMHERGLQVAVGSFGVGQPELRYWAPGDMQLVDLLPIFQQADYLSLHEYSGPPPMADGAGALVLRHRRLVQEIRALGGRVPPILVTECGIEGSAGGWSKYLDWPAYQHELEWLDGQLDQDPDVEAAFLFTSGADELWTERGFAFEETESRWLGGYVSTHPSPAITKPSEEPGAMGEIGRSSREGHRVRYIVIHDTEGPLQAALDWWANPDSKASAHDIITSTGAVLHVVPYDMAAWHVGGGHLPGFNEPTTGNTAIENLVSIGIELEYPKAPSSPAWPQVQLDKAVEVVRGLVAQYDVPRSNLVTHAQCDPVNRSDPRNFPWDWFCRQVYEGITVPADVVRQAGWNASGIPYNRDAAFPAYAREHDLGNPETGEFDFTWQGRTWRGQGFSAGIIYCEIGRWSEITLVTW